MSLLTPDSELLLWIIASFGIAFVILSKYDFPVITKAIEQRKTYIDNSLGTTRQANERLAYTQAGGGKMLAEVKGKQSAVLKEAFTEKERIIEEAWREAASEVYLQIKETTRRIREEKEEAIHEVRSEIVDLSTAIAEEVTREKIDRDREQQQMIDRLLDEVSSSKSQGVNIGTIPSRYVRAFLSLARDRGQGSQVCGDTKMLVDSFSVKPELRDTLSNPIVSISEKVKSLTATGGIEIYKLYTRSINLVLTHKRETLLPFIAYIYTHLYRKEKKITRVRFNTAVATDDAVKSHLQDKLRKETGYTIELSGHVEPKLVGDFRLRTGSYRIDTSCVT